MMNYDDVVRLDGWLIQKGNSSSRLRGTLGHFCTSLLVSSQARQGRVKHRGTVRALQLHCGVIITKRYQQRTHEGGTTRQRQVARVADGRTDERGRGEKEEGGHCHCHSRGRCRRRDCFARCCRRGPSSVRPSARPTALRSSALTDLSVCLSLPLSVCSVVAVRWRFVAAKLN